MGRRCLVILACILLPTGVLQASNPLGIYALVDRVVLEPSPEAPERIQVWGVFSVAEGHGRKGDYYHPPVVGYLYYEASGDGAASLKEWKDLARAAGTGKVVAFASRYEKKGRVRLAGEAPSAPDPHPVAQGVRLLDEHHRYHVVQRLRQLPRPVAPAAGATVDPGEGWRRPKAVTLTARNCLASDPETRYLFELECESGEIIASAPVTPGEKETSWEVPVLLRPGTRYTWRVRIVRGSDPKQPVPVARSHFQVKAAG